VAASVAAGTADVGLGVRAAAQALDLDFVPLTLERYDLALRRADEGAPWFATLLEVLASPAFRADVEALAGYDASRTAWMN
jgi:putative molybdopterin biosynthesis protein